MARLWLLLSAFTGFTGVALGAFAAHGLKHRLTPEYLAVFQTGTQGMITPFGGVAFLVGWLCLGLSAWKLT